MELTVPVAVKKMDAVSTSHTTSCSEDIALSFKSLG